MRQCLRTLTCIRTSTISGWHMKVNWRQSWFALGCKMPWFWHSFTGSWVTSSVGLETLKCGAGSGSGEPKCQGTAQGAFCTLRRPLAAPCKALVSVLGSCTHHLTSKNFAFLRVPVSARLEDKGLLCLELLARSKSHFTDAFSSGVAVVLHQGNGKSTYPVNDWQGHGRSGLTCLWTQRWFPPEVGV